MVTEFTFIACLIAGFCCSTTLAARETQYRSGFETDPISSWFYVMTDLRVSLMPHMLRPECITVHATLSHHDGKCPQTCGPTFPHEIELSGLFHGGKYILCLPGPASETYPVRRWFPAEPARLHHSVPEIFSTVIGNNEYFAPTPCPKSYDMTQRFKETLEYVNEQICFSMPDERTYGVCDFRGPPTLPFRKFLDMLDVPIIAGTNNVWDTLIESAAKAGYEDSQYPFGSDTYSAIRCPTDVNPLYLNSRFGLAYWNEKKYSYKVCLLQPQHVPQSQRRCYQILDYVDPWYITAGRKLIEIARSVVIGAVEPVLRTAVNVIILLITELVVPLLTDVVSIVGPLFLTLLKVFVNVFISVFLTLFGPFMNVFTNTIACILLVKGFFKFIKSIL